MFGLGWTEVLIIVAIAVVLFGNKLPAVGRWLGQSFFETKKGVAEIQDEFARIKK
jgi:sec-independent protein translocase protein TatA